MFALPIIERELRVRARKPWTVWTRVVVGLIISLMAIESLNSARTETTSAAKAHASALRTTSCPAARRSRPSRWLVAGLFAYSTSVELVLRSVNSGWWSAEASNVVSRLLPVADCLLRAIAVCWVGLYLGLRMGSTPRAIGNCLFWTVGVPAVGTMLLEYIFSQLSSPAFLPAGLLVTGPWQPSGLELISNGLNAAYSLYLVAWAQGRLRTRFRELASGD